MQYPYAAVRAAQFLNATTSSSMTPTSTLSGGQPSNLPGGNSNGTPSMIGAFDLYGCVGSTNNFPTFALTGSSDDMSLDFCAASCPSQYFGVFRNDCYCGTEIDTETSAKVDISQCNIPCPGAADQFCGGLKDPLRRRDVPSAALLIVYVRDSVGGGGGGAGAGAGRTTTKTITSTTTGTITSCAPDVTNCPAHKTTGVTTITTTYCPQATPDWHHKKIICYGDYCAPEVPCHECERHRVICDGDSCRPEVCHDNEWDRLVVCKGDDCHFQKCEGDACHQKVVCWDGKCAKEECYGEECHKKFVCKDDSCKHEQCVGDACYHKEVCTGDHCNVVPVCHGPECPVPAPVHYPHPTPGPSNVIVPVGPTHPAIGGSVKTLPAIGFTLGAVAAFAMLL